MTLEVGADLEIRALEQAPSVVVHSVTGLPAGSSPTVVNSGTAQNALLDFGIPAGADGAAGATGAAGANGANATNPTLTIGTVTTLSPGASATVAVGGSYPNLHFDFGIPQGATGSGTSFAWGAATGTLSDQADLQSALNAKAPLASPTLTGTPAAPTAAPGTNTTQLATTAFVAAALGGFAPLASPVFTGNPTAPTPTAGDNDTSVATTAFVHNELTSYAPLAAPALTGDATLGGALIGYRNLPTSRSVAVNFTLADTDKGKKVLFTGGAGKTCTLNPNATTAIDADAIGTIINNGTASLAMARGAGVSAKLMGTGADANRTVAVGGVATWMKVGTDAYFIGGPGVT